MIKTYSVPLHLKNWAKKIGYDEIDRVHQHYRNVSLAFIMAFIMTAILLLIVSVAKGEEINLSIIAKIESNNNPLAYNPKSKARGKYQITEICLDDYNTWHSVSKIASNALFDPVVARKVAEWYLDIRIPQMLKFYGLEPNLENCLICYNFGIGNLVKYRQRKVNLPKETKQYILRYRKLLNKK